MQTSPHEHVVPNFDEEKNNTQNSQTQQDPAPQQTTSMQDGYFDPWDFYFGH